MSYTVFARKYRPQTFDDLVGQEHVARTLKNALETDRVAHAFLFTGVRGVGKTTTARILAKALNCEKGPTATPCNVCDICKDITSGHDLDVLEIDGASNNSVEDVRRLQETIPFQPSRDRYKVVIVDEVHMLSTGAFNAFLKTLEEPPAHVKFIFATTESHKVPVTIRSRCQRYDFRLIPQGVVATAVRKILESEGISADDAAVSLVSREAAGSMRDALTLLDQIVAFSGNALEGATIARTLGIADRDGVHRAAQAVLEGEGADVLEIVAQLADHGLDMLHFSRQLLAYFRDLAVLAVTEGHPGDLLDLVDEERKEADRLIKSVDALEIQRAFASLSTLIDDIARSSHARAVLEMGLLRLATRPRLRAIGELIDRLDALGSPGGGGGGGSRSTRQANAPAQSAARSRTESKARADTGAAARPPTPEKTRVQSQAPTPMIDDAPPVTAAPTPAPEDTPPITGPETKAAQPQAKPSATGPLIQEVPDSPTGRLAAWERVVASVCESKPALGAVLEHAVPIEVSRTQIVLGFAEGSFFGQQASSSESTTAIASAAASILGGKPAVSVKFSAPDNLGASVAEIATTRRDEEREETRRRALNHPRVIEALQVFPEGAGQVKVRLDQEEG